jgi:hypothetical protein
VEKYCKENDIEVCAVRLYLTAYEICAIAVYRAPSGILQRFFQNLYEILNMIFVHTVDIIICGDININYFSDSYHKQHLNSLLAFHGLYSIIQFPTRILKKSYSLIDNIFINSYKFTNFSVYPIINGLSDHDVQNLIIQDTFNQKCIESYYFIHEINDVSFF